MENNRIRAVIVDHFLMKKKNDLSYLCYLGHGSYETLHTVSKAYWKYNRKIFMVSMATKPKQNGSN